MSSPRPWGCFRVAGQTIGLREVFPTPVGVFLRCRVLPQIGRSLPHARGGVSPELAVQFQTRMSSPRPWGCFSLPITELHGASVFPTPVGVFPHRRAGFMQVHRLPHARGGVSVAAGGDFPEYPSSPRPWGCFQLRQCHHRHQCVFPTPVGVFPRSGTGSQIRNCLPHARGGVSAIIPPPKPSTPPSPHPWGCFSNHSMGWWKRRFFPSPDEGRWGAV